MQSSRSAIFCTVGLSDALASTVLEAFRTASGEESGDCAWLGYPIPALHMGLQNLRTSRNIAFQSGYKNFTMELSSVFSKTTKGLDEIATRAHHLPSRVRALLIMVDGQRTGNELLAVSNSAAEGKRQLAALLGDGFIQVQAGSASAAGTAEPPPDEDISLAKSYIVRTLHELLGSAANALIAEIERARSADELQGHIGKLRTALGAASDQRKAEQFLDELALVLD